MMLPHLLIKPIFSLLTMRVSIIQTCLSDAYFLVSNVKQMEGNERAIWTIEMLRFPPQHHPLTLFSSVSNPHGFTKYPDCVPELVVLLRLHFPHSSLPLTLSPYALCVSPVSSFLKRGVSSGFMLGASRGIHGNKPVHGAR